LGAYPHQLRAQIWLSALQLGQNKVLGGSTEVVDQVAAVLFTNVTCAFETFAARHVEFVAGASERCEDCVGVEVLGGAPFGGEFWKKTLTVRLGQGRKASHLPSLENTSTSHKLKLLSTPTNWIATYCPISGLAHENSFVVPSSSVPGYQAHNGFRCKSVLLFPTRISKSCNGWWPQQPRVVILTTFTDCGASKSTRHHGDASFNVSEHSCTSGFWLPGLPSLAKLAGPARVDELWFTGLRKATLMPAKIKVES
jgi:hypothetical protein